MAGVTDIDSPDFDAGAFVDGIASRADEAEKQSLWEKAATTAAKPGGAEGQIQASKNVFGWLKNLPKNITVGTLDAIDSMADFADETMGGPKDGAAPKGQKPFVDSTGHEYDDPLTATWRGGLNELRSRLSNNDTMSDDITQGVAQFAVPFTGWMKVMRGSAAAGKLGMIANAAASEAATVGTNFAPDSGRVADLLDAGRHMEGKFGDTLRMLSPDGSALNGYINYMTDRGDETAADARWKNIVDSLAVSAGVGALLKAAPVAMKTGRYALENAGKGPVGRSAQGGWIGYHGTPHSFDAYDISKVGSGEGNQTYGHGLYFAESKDVAGTYREALTRSGRRDAAMSHALDYVQQSKGDEQKAYTALTKKATELDALGSGVDARAYRKAADIVKAGNAKQRGELHTVQVPDEVVATMGNWDAPRYSQPQNVNKAFDELSNLNIAKVDGKWQATLDSKPIGKKYANIGELTTAIDALTGEDRLGMKFGTAYQQLSDLLGGDKQASEYLKARGVSGIRYLDGASRSKADGTRNLVLFDDKHVKITGKE